MYPYALVTFAPFFTSPRLSNILMYLYIVQVWTVLIWLLISSHDKECIKSVACAFSIWFMMIKDILFNSFSTYASPSSYCFSMYVLTLISCAKINGCRFSLTSHGESSCHSDTRSKLRQYIQMSNSGSSRILVFPSLFYA